MQRSPADLFRQRLPGTNFVAPLFIAALDGLSAVSDGAHPARESIEIDSLAERSALFANLMLDELKDML